MDYTVHGILQARMLEWVVFPFSRRFFPTQGSNSCLPHCRLILFFFFFLQIFICLFYFNWRLITLQYCSGFCNILTWISHGYTYIPHPEPPLLFPPHPIPQGHPGAPGRWILYQLSHQGIPSEVETTPYKWFESREIKVEDVSRVLHLRLDSGGVDNPWDRDV